MTRKLSTPFANDSTQKNVVPITATSSQTDAGLASYSGGFGAKNMLPLDNGGQPPYGQDFNGILNDITGNIVDLNKGLPQYFDSDYATLIGGYPIGARLMLNDNSTYVVSTANGNSNDPNSNLTNWMLKDFNGYDFDVAQPVGYYYNQLGNWDDAIYLAQKNVVALGFSSLLLLPSGSLEFYRPILGGAALGDKLHADYPELGMKDANGVFLKSFPSQVKGSAQPPYSSQGSANNGTSIIFRGCKSQTDLTYMNFGVIHFAPTNPLEFANGTATTQDTWGYANTIIQDLSILGLNQDGTDFATIHGIFLFRHHWHLVRNVQIDACYGAGILANWIYDSNFENVIYTRCGRMSPNINDYQNDGNFSIEYQTYAPLHLLCTDGRDTTNFVKSERGHFENNYRAVADIIVSNATPIWFEKHHHESGQGLTASSKVVIASNYGVKYPCQDSESGFDYKNFEKSTGSTVIMTSEMTGYTTNYKYACILNKYTTMTSDKWRFNADVLVLGGNTNCVFDATQSLFNNMDLSATFAEESLSLNGVTVSGDLKLNYFGAINIGKTRITGNFTATNMAKVYQSFLDDVTAATFTGDLGNCVGKITQTNTTNAGTLQASAGVVKYTNITALIGAW